MKALRKKAKGFEGVGLDDIPEPVPKPNEVKIKVHAAGICGTDLHIVKDEYPANYPVVLGHEYSGTIVELGSEVKGFKPGDRVISLTAVVTCGHCRFCYEGLLMLCPERKSIGSGVDGAMAEYLVVPSHLVYKIPDSVSMGRSGAFRALRVHRPERHRESHGESRGYRPSLGDRAPSVLLLSRSSRRRARKWSSRVLRSTKSASSSPLPWER